MSNSTGLSSTVPAKGNRRGGALPDKSSTRTEDDGSAGSEAFDICESTPRWHVLWTRSNCERSVYEQLLAKGYDVLLPATHKWSRNKRVQCLYCAPLFPGYLFVRHAIDKFSYLEISGVRGVVKILGERWDRLATIPEPQMEAIRKIQESELPRMPHTYLREGQTVRVTTGPLANVRGILVESEPRCGLLVLSVELLAQSVAVKVNYSQVVPA